MNVLLDKDKHYLTPEAEQDESLDDKSVWETLAIAIVLFMVTVVLIISAWSAALLFTGKTGSGGPIGLICQKIIHPD